MLLEHTKTHPRHFSHNVIEDSKINCPFHSTNHEIQNDYKSIDGNCFAIYQTLSHSSQLST